MFPARSEPTFRMETETDGVINYILFLRSGHNFTGVGETIPIDALNEPLKSDTYTHSFQTVRNYQSP